jgi:serine/threonine protein kinase
VLLGLEYLHSKFVFHRDIKPENVFISKSGIVKIGDFGLSREFGTPGQGFSLKVCTAEYRAPEIFFETAYYTEKSDIWAFGCVFAYLFTQKDIFPGAW